MTLSGCSSADTAGPPAFPGPYLVIDRVEVAGPNEVIELVRDGDNWTIADTPFLVDARAAAALETSLRRRWDPSELRPIAHTAEALGLRGEEATSVTVWPADSVPVRFTIGRTEPESPGRWILPEGASIAGFVPEADALVGGPLHWRSEKVCALSASEVGEVWINGGLRASRDGREWRGDGVDGYRVEQLVRRLAGLDAAPIAAVEIGDASTLIEFELVGPERSCAIGLYESPEGDFVMTIDRVLGFDLDAEETQTLLAAPRSLGTPERLALVPESVRSVKLRGQAVLVLSEERRWVSDTEEGRTDCDRYVRTLCRLDAEHDAPEIRATFALPRRRVRVETEDEVHHVDLTWDRDGAVFARVDGGPPFRVESSSHRVLRGEPCVDPG